MPGTGLPNRLDKVLPTGNSVYLRYHVITTILHRKTIRGSIVGTRKDLNEALQIAALGSVKCTVEEKNLDDIDQILNDMAAGKIKGRVVLRIAPDE